MDTLLSRATEFSHICKMKGKALYLVLRGMVSNICIGYCVEYIRKVCTEEKNCNFKSMDSETKLLEFKSQLHLLLCNHL